METRSKTDVEARSKAIRNATPRGDHFLENLYEMSNRICDLCEQPIQDFILAELEHSVSVDSFARSSLLIEEAIAQCHHPRNLRIAHYSCNGSKHNMSREEWFASGRNKEMGTPRIWTEAELLLRQFQLGERARAGGQVSGRNHKENHTGIFGRSTEQRRNDLQKAGRANVESGHTSALGRSGIGGRANVSRNKEMNIGIFALGIAAKAGRIGGSISGRKNVESGQLARIRTPEHQRAAAKIGAPIAGRTSCHLHWHVKRNIPNPSCRLCLEAKLIKAA